MPDQPNGTIARGVSTFEDDFREFNGRAPTAEEVRRHLAFDRLAKSSSLDPLTMLLVVDAGRGDRDEISAQLGRLEALVRRSGKPTAAEPEVGIVLRDLIVAAITICAMIIVALLMGAGAGSFVTIFAAFLLGLGGTVAYVSLAPLVGRRQ